MPISIILDVVISVLLVLTIIYAVRLNQRLSQLRADKHELQHLADTFVEATKRAEAGIAQLKISSDGLSADITHAETLKDDLDYLVDRGERIANALMEETRAPQNMPQSAFKATSKPAPVRKPSPRAVKARKFDPEARLIEDALRAATPRYSDDVGTNARRDDDDEDDGGIGDSQAARELLKALGTVK